MIIHSLQEFYQLCQVGQPIISVDHGNIKMGLAISSPDHYLALPLQIIAADSDKKIILQLVQVIKQKNACALVIGLPINMDGTKSEQTIKVENFANQIQKQINLPIFLQDERLTSKAADNFLKNFGMKRKQRNAIDDLTSASMILETTLNSISKFAKPQ